MPSRKEPGRPGSRSGTRRIRIGRTSVVLVIPVGEPFAVQSLLLVRKRENGDVSVRQILPVRFVPLTGGH